MLLLFRGALLRFKSPIFISSFLVWAGLFGFGAPAWAVTCWKDLKARSDRNLRTLETRYRQLDPNFEQISAINRPELQAGRQRSVVMLIHGFMGSPDEMRGLARKLQSQGHFIYNALIPGFGGNAVIANHFERDIWSRWVGREVRALEKCFSKIHLVGFSTGGLLVYDHLIRKPKDSKVVSATFVSPYFETHNVFFNLLQSASSWVFPTISVDAAYGFGALDLKIMTIKRDSYLQEVPVRAAQQVVALGREVRWRSLKRQILPMSALVFLSKDDLVIRESTAARIIQESFESSSLNYYESAERIPHHMMVPEVSPVADLVEKHIVQTISR